MSTSDTDPRSPSLTPPASGSTDAARSKRPDLRRVLAAVIAAGSVAVVGIGAMPATEAQAAGVVHGVRHLHSTSA